MAPNGGTSESDLLRFITCGSVDDGKSTLIGRLLYDSKAIFDDQAAVLEAESRRVGTQSASRASRSTLPTAILGPTNGASSSPTRLGTNNIPATW